MDTGYISDEEASEKLNQENGVENQTWVDILEKEKLDID
jgi:hypothetical protein